MPAPGTAVNIYRDVPMTPSSQRVFRTDAARASFYNSYRVTQVTGVLHINRSRGFLKLTGSAQTWLDCNMLSFNNTNWENQPVYCWVTGVEQLGKNTVKIGFEVADFQTWMFDVKFLPSHIEREHLSASEKALEDADPYRMDVVGLITSEELIPDETLEVTYRQSYNLVGSDGLPELYGKGAKLTPNGVSGLRQTVGYDSSVMPATYLFLGTWDSKSGTGPGDFLAAMQNGAPPSVSIAALLPSARNGFFRGTIVYRIVPTSESDATAVSLALRRGLDWLTVNNLTSQLVCNPITAPVAMGVSEISRIGEGSGAGSSDTASRFVVTPAPYNSSVGYEPVNKKLYRAPYRVVRITSPNGSVGEFPFEYFDTTNAPSGFNDHKHAARFFLYYSFDESVSQTVVPVLYKGSSVGYQNRMVFSNYPQSAYSTDGFLAYLAAKSQEAIMNDTPGSKKQRSNPVARGLSDFGSYLSSMVSNPMGAITGANAADYGRENEIAAQAYALQSLTGSEVQGVRNGDVAAPPFENQRAATQADEYHAGNVENALGARLMQLHWTIDMVTLQGSVLKTFDQYFTLYGYASGRLGTPRVVEWISGGTAPYFGTAGTYVKTKGANVYGIPITNANRIADMFDAGVRFYQG